MFFFLIKRKTNKITLNFDKKKNMIIIVYFRPLHYNLYLSSYAGFPKVKIYVEFVSLF